MPSEQPHDATGGRRTRVEGGAARVRADAWRRAWPVYLCGLVYLMIAGGFRCQYEQTDFAHHLYIADALLHGQTHLRPEALEQMEALATRRADAVLAAKALATGKPPTVGERQEAIRNRLNSVTLLDWSIVNGKVYGYWAPLTPVAMMPLVALFGPGISDRLLSALFGILNLALFQYLLRRVNAAGLLAIDGVGQTALTLALGLGTVHFYMCCSGTSWLMAQIVTLTAVLAACLAAVGLRNRRRDVLISGIFFGAALLGRNIVVMLAPFFLILIYARTIGFAERRRELLRRGVLFGIPLVAAVALQGAYNYARFGDPLESGQAALIHLTGHPRFAEEYDRYGQFHPYFLTRNAKHYLWNWAMPKDEAGRLSFDPDGNSMFLVSPLLLYALLAWRRRNAFTLALACGAGAYLLALLMFRATGFHQFGNRYLLESLPLWLLLAATGMSGRLTPSARVLLAVSIAINAFGTYRVCEPLLPPFPL